MHLSGEIMSFKVNQLRRLTFRILANGSTGLSNVGVRQSRCTHQQLEIERRVKQVDHDVGVYVWAQESWELTGLNAWYRM